MSEQETAAPPRPRWYRSLFAQVLIGIALGIATGLLFPGMGEHFRPLGEGFIKLIKMLVAPLIFLVIVTGIAKVGGMKALGQIGGKAVGNYGAGSLKSFGVLILACFGAAIVFIVLLSIVVRLITGAKAWKFVKYCRDEFMLALGTGSSEAVLPRIIKKLDNAGCDRALVGLVVPTGYSFNLECSNRPKFRARSPKRSI